MNDSIKQALDLAQPSDQDPRDEGFQERTMSIPVLSGTELKVREGAKEEAAIKAKSLKPLL